MRMFLFHRQITALSVALVLSGVDFTSAASTGQFVEGDAVKLPISVIWTYRLGKDQTIAPDGLRFWSTNDGKVWVETYADGKVRNHFDFISRFFLDTNRCNGILLRRSDNMFLAFLPDSRCHAEPLVYYQDIDTRTGQATGWRILGRIMSETF
jgi:hypothetical protein